MLRLALMLTLLIALCGRLHALAASDLVGTWGISWPETWEALKKAPQLASLPADQVETMEKLIEGQMAKMTFEFSADKLTMNAMGQKKEGAYKVVATEGDKLKLEVTDPDSGEVKATTAEMKGDKLYISLDEQTMVLKKGEGETK